MDESERRVALESGKRG